MEDEEMDVNEGWRGNLRRRLWKLTCTRAALNVIGLPHTLSAIYSSFCLNPIMFRTH